MIQSEANTTKEFNANLDFLGLEFYYRIGSWL